MRNCSRALRVAGSAALALFTIGVAAAEAQTATAGQIIISEFRLRGPSGAQDEFIELYNASGASHTVVAASGTGYGVAASDGTTRCSIPNGTVIPNRGHYLCVNSASYSLGRQRDDGHRRCHLHDRHSGQRRHRALQQQHRRRQLQPGKPARRGGVHQ